MSAEKILYGRTDINMSGPGVVMLKTASHLVRRGYEVSVVSGGGYLEDEFKANGVNVHVIEELAINKRSMLNVVFATIKLRRIIRKNNIKIIHGHSMLFTLIAYIATIFSGVKYKFFTTIHGVGKEWVCKYLPGTIIVVSSYLKNHLVGLGVNKEKISILPNGLIEVPLSDKDKNEGELLKFKKVSDKFIIINVAMMLESKGHYEAICVLEKLLEYKCNVEMLFVGDGVKKEELISKSKEKGVCSNIQFLGVRKDVSDLLAGSDLFLHLPASETFGMSIMEAMSERLPVIASNAGAIPELINDGYNGYLVERSDSEAIALKVIYLIENRGVRKMLGDNSFKVISDSYQIKKTIDDLVSLYG